MVELLKALIFKIITINVPKLTSFFFPTLLNRHEKTHVTLLVHIIFGKIIKIKIYFELHKNIYRSIEIINFE
jgi:hypothetical protein